MSNAFTNFELSSDALISYCFSYSAPSAISHSFFLLFIFLIVSNTEGFYWWGTQNIHMYCMVSGKCDLCLCFDCSFINHVLSIIDFNTVKFFCKEVVLFTSSSVAVMSSVPISFLSFYSPQPVSVNGPKSLGYFLDFIGQHFRLTSSWQCIWLKATSHSLIPSTAHPVTQFLSVIIIEACVLKHISC